MQFETCVRFLGFAFVLDSSKAKGELISGGDRDDNKTDFVTLVADPKILASFSWTLIS